MTPLQLLDATPDLQVVDFDSAEGRALIATPMFTKWFYLDEVEPLLEGATQ